MFAVIEGPDRGWTSAVVLGSFLAGVGLTVAFVTRELRCRAPLFDVRVLSRSVVSAGAITLLAAYFVFNGMLFLLPQYLQDVQGEAIATVGLLLVPFAAVFGVASTRAAVVLQRLGARLTVTLGLGISAVGSVLLAIGVDRGLAFSVVASGVVGAGLSLLIAPASTVVMNALPETKAGDGSSLNMVSRFIGGAVGVAVVGSVLASIYASRLSDAVASLSPALSPPTPTRHRVRSRAGSKSRRRCRAPRRTTLATAARDAFDRGATAGYVVLACFAALSAAWAWWALRPDKAAQARSG